MKSEKELQEKFIEFQLSQQRVKQMHQQLQKLSQQKEEVESIKSAIKELNSVKGSSEILVPVASGIFARARIEDCSNLMINVGNNIVVEKTSFQAEELLEIQSLEIKKMEKHFSSQIEYASAEISKLECELQKMIDEAKKDV